MPARLRVAGEFGVCWWTVMNAVIEHGTPLVDDPDRVGWSQLGVDETCFLAATATIVYATGLVDLERAAVIDFVEGNSPGTCGDGAPTPTPTGWQGSRWWPPTQPRSRAGLTPGLDHAPRIADPFHVVRVANRCVDHVRRRVQNETLGHRGRKPDPFSGSANC